jgi:hypothetical protein
VHFVGPGEEIKPRLFQTLTRSARPDSNLRSAVQISNPLPSRYTPWGQLFFLNPDCLRFLQEVHTLTRTRDLLCRSQTLCHHATPLGTLINTLTNSKHSLIFLKIKIKQIKNFTKLDELFSRIKLKFSF